MLKGIPKILSPELLKILAEMGHGDEIVIADDGSHKDYSALLAAFPAVRYLKLEHRGLSAARVAGAQSAEG